MKRVILLAALVVVAVVLLVPGANYVYQAGGGEACARCHEIAPQVEVWRQSAHRGVRCEQCHHSSMLTNAGRVRAHWAGEVPARPRMKHADVLAMTERCRSCHQQEYAQWRNGPHSVTYESLFLDKKHNAERMLMDDCFRCHGMHFEGGIEDLVRPANREGPWALMRADLKDAPALPCLSCHSMHREGAPLRGHARKAEISRKEEIARPSLALFDRRTLAPISLRDLPLPVVHDGERPVKMSPDPRQGLCYQCHAPLAGGQIKSGDDRTPMGVHEGISCLACHDHHRGTTRTSCATCHPRLSNCGLDVETMDTTFASKESKHNIHWVKCADCHPKGVPAKRTAALSSPRLAP